MQRLLSIFLSVLFVALAFPRPAQVGLVCRMTGQAMQPVAVKDNPTSCCAVRTGASGTAEMANRSCCNLKITPGHAPLPGAVVADAPSVVAVLPTLPWVVPIPACVAVAPPFTRPGVPPCHGPPTSPTSPRAPPFFS